MKLLAKLVPVILCMSLCFSAQSQSDYTSAIGVRLGYPFSVSYKQFLSSQNAVELFAGFRSFTGYSWVNIGGLFQRHAVLTDDVPGLQWYFGGGVGVYFWNYKFSIYDDESNFSFGILGNLGLDYKFESAPVNLSLDWVPAFFVNGFGSGFGGGYGALAIRYTLK